MGGGGTGLKQELLSHWQGKVQSKNLVIWQKTTPARYPVFVLLLRNEVALPFVPFFGVVGPVLAFQLLQAFSLRSSYWEQ